MPAEEETAIPETDDLSSQMIELTTSVCFDKNCLTTVPFETEFVFQAVSHRSSIRQSPVQGSQATESAIPSSSNPISGTGIKTTLSFAAIAGHTLRYTTRPN